MTIKECQENHKKLWNWIADETEKRRLVIRKSEYFCYLGIHPFERPRNCCYCCEYADFVCHKCPINWEEYLVEDYDPTLRIICEKKSLSPYAEYITYVKKYADSPLTSEEAVELSELAREIANLPFFFI